MNRQDDVRFELSPDDKRLLDALVEARFDLDGLEATSPADRARAQKILGLMGLMNDYPVEDADDTLIHATLARINRCDDERAARLSFDTRQNGLDEARSGRRIRLPDFVSVAAILLIGLSVMWPAASHLRQRAIDDRCATNLYQVGLGFGNYVMDYNDAMPVNRAGIGPSWDTVRNFINLNPLVEGGYCQVEHLSCPGHEDATPSEVSYSYQWQIPGAASGWGVGPRRLVVLGDRNPLIDAFRAGRLVPALSISLNHNGRGQNVLFDDGGTRWFDQPVVGGDNIWLPKGQEALRAGAIPAADRDTFLAH